MFRVEVVSLGVDQAARTPILVLKKEDGDEAFTLSLSHLEAAMIAAVLKGEAGVSPVTHHLFANFVRQMGYRVLRAEIKDFHGRDKKARILFGSDSEDKIAMDAKTSDAIAMALCFDAPLFLGVEAVQNPAKTSGKVFVMDESSEGKKLTDYLESLDTERFGHA